MLEIEIILLVVTLIMLQRNIWHVVRPWTGIGRIEDHRLMERDSKFGASLVSGRPYALITGQSRCGCGSAPMLFLFLLARQEEL